MLNEEIFDTLDDARRKIALWRYDDNAIRPHSSLGNLTPLEVRQMLTLPDSTTPGTLVIKPPADCKSQMLCPRETGTFEVGVFGSLSQVGKGAENDEGIGVYGSTKAFILKQGEEGTPVAEICRKAGISQATYFNWKKRYGGLLTDEMRRLKALEDENSRLKKIVADLTLDRETLQDVIRRKL